MKKIRNLIVVFICVAAVSVIGGCTSNTDVSDYLKALLDVSYKNDTSGFVNIKLGTKDEAKALYNQGIDEGVSAFCESLNVPNELEDDFRKLYTIMLKSVKYEVGESVKQSDGSYIVTVTYEKMNVFKPAVALYNESAASLVDGWANSGEEIEDSEKQSQIILEFKNCMETVMSKVTYDEPREMTVRIELIDNQYTPNESDIQALEKALMDWE